MIKTITAIGVAALAGSAVAAPFSVAGAQISAAEIGSDNGTFINFSLSGGVVPFTPNPGTFNGAFGMANQPLLGAHGGALPALGAFDVATAGPLVSPVDGNNWAGAPDDSSFNVGFTIPAPANHVGSGEGPFSADDVWVGRLPGGSRIDLLEVIFSTDVTLNLPFALDGAGTDVDGQTLFAKSLATEGSTNGAIDIWITAVPTPGAAAVLGLAGFAGLRRRRG